MKIRKILPLIALAVIAVFALASCDDILESIYPEQTTGLNANTNALTLEVSTNSANLTKKYKEGIYVGPLSVKLYKNGVLYDQRTTLLDNPKNEPIILTKWSFDKLPDGSYYAEIWIDSDHDGVWTKDPADYLGNPMPTGTYTLAGSDTGNIISIQVGY